MDKGNSPCLLCKYGCQVVTVHHSSIGLVFVVSKKREQEGSHLAHLDIVHHSLLPHQRWHALYHMWIRREMGDWCCSPWYCLLSIHCWLPCGWRQPGSCFMCEKREGEGRYISHLDYTVNSDDNMHHLCLDDMARPLMCQVIAIHCCHSSIGLVMWRWIFAMCSLKPHAPMGLWSGIERWWAWLNDGGGRWWGWHCSEGGWLGRKWLFVDNVFVCWMFVNTMFVLNVPRKTGYNWSLSGLANIEITTNWRLDCGYS